MTSLHAPYAIEFPFERTVGPKIGAFLGGLREAKLYGVRAADGAILCPAHEFDPRTGLETGELVLLPDCGTLRSWTWVPSRPEDAVPQACAWGLIEIDGTVGALLHALDTGGDMGQMAIGMRVRARWRTERVGSIRDIECFEPVS